MFKVLSSKFVGLVYFVYLVYLVDLVDLVDLIWVVWDWVFGRSCDWKRRLTQKLSQRGWFIGLFGLSEFLLPLTKWNDWGELKIQSESPVF